MTTLEVKKTENVAASRRVKEVLAAQWFETLVGFPEGQWDLTVSSLPETVHAAMGMFRCVSVGELQQEVDKLKQGDAKKEDKSIKDLLLTVRTFGRDEQDNEADLDTSALQVKALPGATFQVASNFDCHEMASERGSPFDGRYLTRLMTDKTQGPSAAAGAAAGAMLRLAMHKQSPINLLSATDLRTSTNGKLHARGLVPLETKTAALAIQVGWHTNTKALFDRSRNQCLLVAQPPTIHQVLTSTAIVSNPKKLKPKERTAVRQLLDCAYQATYLCAALSKSPQLVLTLIGGGSFCNPPEDIVAALVEAHTLISPCLPDGCQVMLPIYDADSSSCLQLLQSTHKRCCKDASWSVRLSPSGK